MFTRAILLLAASLSAFTAVNAQSASASEILTVSYCNLFTKADAYDGKQIRLSAEYNSGFEHSVVSDQKCVERFDPKQLIWVGFADSVDVKTKPGILAKFKEALYRPKTNKRGEITDQWKNWYVELTIVGMFHKSKDPSFGFGHTNAYPLMIVVSKIEKVGKSKQL